MREAAFAGRLFRLKSERTSAPLFVPDSPGKVPDLRLADGTPRVCKQTLGTDLAIVTLAPSALDVGNVTPSI